MFSRTNDVFADGAVVGGRKSDRKLSPRFGDTNIIKKIKKKKEREREREEKSRFEKLLIIYFPFHVLPIKFNFVRDKLHIYESNINVYTYSRVHHASRVN